MAVGSHHHEFDVVAADASSQRFDFSVTFRAWPEKLLRTICPNLAFFYHSYDNVVPVMET